MDGGPSVRVAPAAFGPAGGAASHDTTAAAFRPRRWAILFGAWSLVTVLWSLSIGPGGSPDEPTHVIKAAAVGTLQFGTDVTWGSGGFDSSYPRSDVEVARGYHHLNRAHHCWTADLAVPVSCVGPFDDGRVVATTTYVGTYPPTYYLAVGWPANLVSPRPSMYAMRVIGALLAAAFLAEGTLQLTRDRASPFTIIAVALALPASALFLAASVNPNGLEVAAAFCLWAVVAERCRAPDRDHRRNLIVMVGSAGTLSWIRPLGPAFVVVILAVAFGALADGSTVRSLRSRRARGAGALLATALVAAVGYAVVNRSYESLITYESLARRSPATAARAAWDDLPMFLDDSWSLLGWIGGGDLRVPRAITLAWLAAIVVLALTAVAAGTARQRFGLLLLVVGSIVGPMVPSAMSPGTPWQGRYLLPLLIGVPLLSGAILSRSPRAAGWRLPRAVPLLVVASVAGSYVVAHQLLMNRTAVGLPAGPLANLTRGSWTGPLPPVVLFVWALASAALWGAVLVHQVPPGPELRRGGRPPSDDGRSAS